MNPNDSNQLPAEWQRFTELKLLGRSPAVTEALDAANAGIWEWHLATNQYAWSDSTWQLYGLAPASFQPSHSAWLSLVHPDDRDTVEKIINQTLQKSGELSLEWRLAKRINNKERWFFSRGLPKFSAYGELEQYRGIVLEITEQKLNEQKLREKERLLADTQKIAHIGSWVYYVGTGQVIWSDEMFRLMGLPPETDPPSAFEQYLDLIHPDDRDAVKRWHENSLAGYCPAELEYRTRQINGKHHWLLHYGVLERDSQGNPLRLAGTVQDITETKSKNAGKQRQADAFHYCAHGIAIENPESQTLIGCNPAFAKILGYDTLEMEGMSIWSLYPPDQAELVKMYLPIVDNFGSMSFESAYRRKDGSHVNVQVDLVSDKDLQNKVNYRVATVLNVLSVKPKTSS